MSGYLTTVATYVCYCGHVLPAHCSQVWACAFLKFTKVYMHTVVLSTTVVMSLMSAVVMWHMYTVV
jgi:hypothetical protein